MIAIQVAFNDALGKKARGLLLAADRQLLHANDRQVPAAFQTVVSSE